MWDEENYSDYYSDLSTRFALDPKWWSETALKLFTETKMLIEIWIKY